MTENIQSGEIIIWISSPASLSETLSNYSQFAPFRKEMQIKEGIEWNMLAFDCESISNSRTRRKSFLDYIRHAKLSAQARITVSVPLGIKQKYAAQSFMLQPDLVRFLSQIWDEIEITAYSVDS